MIIIIKIIQHRYQYCYFDQRLKNILGLHKVYKVHEPYTKSYNNYVNTKIIKIT